MTTATMEMEEIELEVPKMNRRRLAEEVARRCNCSDEEAEQIVTTVLDSIAKALRRKERVELRGFGSFYLRERRARKGKNPRNGADVDVAEKRVTRFRPSKIFLKELNGEITGPSSNGNGRH